MDRFVRHFQVGHSDASFKARQYLQGLLQTGDRKNIERMQERVPDSDYQSLHQFISNSPWDAQDVMDEAALMADELIGDPEEACLIIDETSQTKKGTKSVGVARQYLGCVGKVDNGQVGVFTALCRDEHVTLIHGKVYLPKEWVTDKYRCIEAKVPLEEIVHQTKDEMALDQVRRARALGIRFGWVLADAGYGKGPGFLFDLDDMKERFVVDVHKDFMVYTCEPDVEVPQKQGRRGRTPTRAKADIAAVEVRELLAAIPEEGWVTHNLRRSTKGPVVYQFCQLRVWVWDKPSGRVRPFHLIARKDSVTSEIKYSLSNAKEETDLLSMARAQAQRYWVERAFQDCKSACGMKDYQIRGWVAWHHHMALVILAQLFMLEQRILHKEEHPNLTCKDIEYLLSKMLPRKDLTIEDALRLVLERNKRRNVIYAANRG